MPRTLTEIKTHLRAVIANGSISTTLIQTEDLAALCDAADVNAELLGATKFAFAAMNSEEGRERAKRALVEAIAKAEA